MGLQDNECRSGLTMNESDGGRSAAGAASGTWQKRRKGQKTYRVEISILEGQGASLGGRLRKTRENLSV